MLVSGHGQPLFSTLFELALELVLLVYNHCLPPSERRRIGCKAVGELCPRVKGTHRVGQGFLVPMPDFDLLR